MIYGNDGMGHYVQASEGMKKQYYVRDHIKSKQAAERRAAKDMRKPIDTKPET